jgi:diguanylate cyclase (GGDEF)-like protein/PAS domain S-box-containing protein
MVTSAPVARPSNRVSDELRLVIAAFVVYAGVLVLADGAWTRHVSDASFVVFPALAGLSCHRRARRSTGRDRTLWTWIAVSMWTWAAGGAFWFYDGLDGSYGFPGPAEVGLLGYAVPAAVGLLAIPSVRTSGRVRLSTVLDTTVIALSVLFVSWATVLSPTITSAAGATSASLVIVAYPVVDVVVVALALARSMRAASAARPAHLLLCAGFVCLATVDSVYVRLVQTGAYESGTLLDLGWATAFLLVALAPRVPASTEQVRQRLTVPQELIPYGALLAAAAVGLGQPVTVLHRPVLFVVAVALMAMALVRQFLIVVEKARLANSLERRVTRTTQALEREQEFHRALIENLHAAVLACDRDGNLTFHNAATARLHGDPGETRIADWAQDVFAVDGVTPLRREQLPLTRALNGERVHDEEVVVVAPGAAPVTVVVSGRALRDVDGDIVGAVVAMHDVTERRRQQEALLERSLRDDLTGLGNRQAFRDTVDEHLRAGRPVHVLLIDLDDFKHINDSLGHHAGDACLIEIADRLRSTLPAGATASRLGGDEFVVVLPGGAPGDADALAERLLGVICAVAEIDGTELETTGSIGVASSSREQGSVTALLKAADLAMYLAKSQGKGRSARFEPHMQDVASERLALEADLRKAVRGNKLAVVYQPVVDLDTGKVNGVEALVRWTHFQRGPVSPAQFIPIAEEAGLIGEIGEFVLREASAQLLSWDAQGGDARLKVNVNVSTRQLERGALLPTLDDSLASGVDPARLVLEITETALTVDGAATTETLNAIRDRGVHLAVDDFGTGYSSLSRLRSAPVSWLKIDRSFVKEIADAHVDVPIVEATMAMARGLGLGIVAEGVETEEQLAYLRGNRCPEAQGFLFSPPVAPDKVLEFMTAVPPWAHLLAASAPECPVHENLSHLVELAVSPSADVEALLRPLLRDLQLATGLTMTYLTRVDTGAGEQTVEFVHSDAPGPLQEGLVVPWAETLCKRALEQGPRRTDDAQRDYEGTAVARDLGVRGYIVEPVVRPNGELYGTLCGASTESRLLTEADSATLRMFARLVTQKLEQAQGRSRQQPTGGLSQPTHDAGTTGTPLTPETLEVAGGARALSR